MAKAKEKKKLEKKGFIAQFIIVGEAKVNDFTFKIDAESEKSDWIYNSLNLGVFCGEKHGTVYTEMMGGYGKERSTNKCFAHGKKEDGSDDFTKKVEVAWDDRFDESILEELGDLSFLTVGLEKDKNDKTFYKKFLSQYDAILYIKEHLKEGMVVNVKGTIEYQPYGDTVNVKKKITSIVLSKADDASKYHANFTQTMLLKKGCIGDYDASKNSIPIYATVLEYAKEWKGKTIEKQFIPLSKAFEYELVSEDKELQKKAVKLMFNVDKDVTEITFEGDFVEGGALITATEDDIPEEIMALVAIGAYTMEEALAKCTENGGREKRMIIRKPMIKMVGEEGAKTPQIQKFDKKYTEDDLILDFMFDKDDEDGEAETNMSTKTETSENDMDWLKNLQ